MSRHEETVCLSERSEILCYLVLKYTSCKYATTIRTQWESFVSKGNVTYATLSPFPYIYTYINTYIYF